jgi:hypothetical protein
MTHSLIFSLEKAQSNEKGAEGSKTYRAIASTAALDRDKEVLLPKGVITENFLKNPVMLFIHNYKQVPVGKVTKIDVTKEAVSFEFEFAETDIAKEIKSLYDDGFMSAFSVGLYPQKSFWVDENSPQKFEVEYPDGTKDTIDLGSYKETPHRIVTSWELLEISPVPVPSNPEALLLRTKEDILRKCVESNMSKGVQQIVSASLDSRLVDLKDLLDHFISDAKGIAASSVIEYKETLVDCEKDWDALRAQASLAKFSTEDGKGEKENIDWGLYSQGFAYVDLDHAEKLSSYKYAHHHVIDKNVVAIFKGVAKSMAQVLKDKESLGDDAKGVYEHLASHYKDANIECPEFEVEYTEDQLKSIESGVSWKSEEEENTPEENTPEEQSDPDQKDDSSKALNAVTSSIKEFEEIMSLRLTLLTDTLDNILDLVKQIQKSKSSESTESSESDPEPDEDSPEKTLERELKTLSDFLSSNSEK